MIVVEPKSIILKLMETAGKSKNIINLFVNFLSESIFKSKNVVNSYLYLPSMLYVP